MSIHDRNTASGRRYDVRLRDPSGRMYARSFRTKKEAELFEANEHVERAKGAWVDPRQGTILLKEWSVAWLEQRPNLRSRTRETYQGLLDRHILPYLGKVELSAITPSLVRQWHAGLVRAETPGPSTVAKAYRLLRAMMRSAVIDERIGRSPCLIAGAGTEHAPERPVATVAEIAALADAITPRFRALVLMASWCSLRSGELLALRRSDLNLPNGTVRIERVLSQLQKGGLEIGPPKTKAGKRTVGIPPHIVKELAQHLRQFVDLEMDALVFTGVKGGPVRKCVLQTEWSKARTKVGLVHFHFHDLRHSGNTWAAATGASTKELMARMGHADERTALIYQHSTADREQVIARALSGLAEAASVTPIRERKGKDKPVPAPYTYSACDECAMEQTTVTDGDSKKAG